ncbi:MAG: response regulator transcription factor [Acidobacteriota bacterium]
MSILIVEDEAVYRKFLQDLIEKEFEILAPVEVACSAQQGLEKALDSKPDLILMDIQMPADAGDEASYQRIKSRLRPEWLRKPAHSGMIAAKVLWKMLPHSRILFITNFTDEQYLIELEESLPKDTETTFGYIIKNKIKNEQEYVDVIRRVLLEGECVVSPEVARRRKMLPPRRNALTNSEMEILKYMALGLKYPELTSFLSHLRGRPYSPRTVEYWGTKIIDKLLEEDIGGDDEARDSRAFNLTSRAAAVALMRGIINAEALREAEDQLKKWWEGGRQA